jgi:nucleotide-binding universal stress UspA family protein
VFKRILAPTDGSIASMQAARAGVDLARELGATVIFITVSKPWSVFSLDPIVLSVTNEKKYLEDTARVAGVRLQACEEYARSQGVNARSVHIYEEPVWKAIVEEARNLQCDLIHMAAHGRRGGVALVIGSTTGKVLTHAPAPVLVHRGEATVPR